MTGPVKFPADDAEFWYNNIMRAEIISIGTELLLGDIVNTNAAYLARKLAELGVDLYHQTTVGDNPQRLADAIRRALGRSDAVILTGGLGPTVDDITAATVAQVTGKRLVLNERALKNLKDYFTLRGLKMPAGNMRQAHVPEGARTAYNAVGTAPGLIVDYRGRVIICLPGPPREMQPMLESDVAPFLKKRFKPEGAFRTRTIKTVGLPEARVDRMMKDLLSLAPPTTVGIYAKLREVHLVIMSKAKSARLAARAIAAVEKKIRSRLKDHIFGCDDETLESAVGDKLLRRKMTIAVAESCTGGLIASRVTDISGSSKYFKAGIVAYSNEAKESFLGVSSGTLKRYGAVSGQVALEMAKGIKHYGCADIGVGTTGIAGPKGRTASKPIGLVYIAIATDTKQFAKEWRFRGSRQDIKWQASQAALNMVRLNI
jgi:nicotinamide-nucleotide amidase